MKSESYIKLFRKITEWEHFQDSRTLHVFLYLLVMAVRNRTRYGEYVLKKGQFITSYRDLQQNLGMCAKYVTESVQKLKNSGEITTEKCRYGTLFTIVNYEDYQGTESKPHKDDEKPRGNGIGCTDF